MIATAVADHPKGCFDVIFCGVYCSDQSLLVFPSSLRNRYWLLNIEPRH